MKKSSIVLISIGIIFLAFILIVAIYKFVIPLFILGSAVDSNEELISTSVSPNGSITLEAYKDNGSATVDYSIKVYRVTDTTKDLIYNAYHEYEVDISWINDKEVSINGNLLDLSKGETYDWRTD